MASFAALYAVRKKKWKRRKRLLYPLFPAQGLLEKLSNL